MFCPRCAVSAVEGQPFCRNCGLKLSVILDAMGNRPPQSPLDFETLKRDLRDLGSSLRSGFEGASQAINKHTKRLQHPSPPSGNQPQLVMPDFSKELKRAIRKVKAADSRKVNFQKATLSLFGGGAIIFVWQRLLEAFTRPEVITNLENLIHQAKPELIPVNLEAYVPFIQMLWLLGLIPIVKGIAYLVNAIFFAPKPELEPDPQVVYTQPMMQPPPAYTSAVPDPSTNEFDRQGTPQYGVTEDSTLRFEPKH
jgi:hypothetical protein